MQDHYKVLGLKPGVSDKQIYRAYRALAKKFHPDSGHEEASTRKFRELKHAYEMLKSQASRSKYDAQLKALNEIERFQMMSRHRRVFEKQSTTPFSYAGSQRRKPAKVLEFPKQKNNGMFLKAFRPILAFIFDKFLFVKEEYTEAKTRRENEHHKILTRKLNRIPDSEIGLRQAS